MIFKLCVPKHVYFVTISAHHNSGTKNDYAKAALHLYYNSLSQYEIRKKCEITPFY